MANFLKRFLDFKKSKFNNDYSIKLLIELTEFTIPYGNEHLVYDTIRRNCKKDIYKDNFGNLFTKIGKSKILFTAHMDTYSNKVEKVKHVIDAGFLKTDQNTILGADNKIGCAILINMINNNIPGTYYFFCGEEVGRLGSEYYNSIIDEGEYDLAIAFDRKSIGSVCTHQRGIKLCNDNLSNFIIQEFSKSGFNFNDDFFGLSCDTYTFKDKINNCLNISSGVYDEHKKTERVDINYYNKLFHLCPKINWTKIEYLSQTKVREKMSLDKLNIKNNIIKNTLDFFIKNGYNPTTIPEFDQQIGIYTSNLYFKINPKIFDYFYIKIKKNGLIEIDNLILTKEEVMEYINCYKKIWMQFIFDGQTYHIMDIVKYNNRIDINVLSQNEGDIIVVFDENFDKCISHDDEIFIKIIKNIINFSNILKYFK